VQVLHQSSIQGVIGLGVALRALNTFKLDIHSLKILEDLHAMHVDREVGCMTWFHFSI